MCKSTYVKNRLALDVTWVKRPMSAAVVPCHSGGASVELGAARAQVHDLYADPVVAGKNRFWGTVAVRSTISAARSGLFSVLSRRSLGTYLEQLVWPQAAAGQQNPHREVAEGLFRPLPGHF